MVQEVTHRMDGLRYRSLAAVGTARPCFPPTFILSLGFSSLNREGDASGLTGRQEGTMIGGTRQGRRSCRHLLVRPEGWVDKLRLGQPQTKR